MQDALQRYPVPSPSAIGRPVDEEAVIVLTDKGQVKVLNELGARIWALADGTRRVEEIVSLLCLEYDVERAQAEADTLAFLDELARRGALSIEDEPGERPEVSQNGG